MNNVSIYNFGYVIVFSTAKGFLSNFIPTLHPESFILCKKAVYNGLCLKVYIPFELRT